jgi:tartrate dehydratase alpha subunit/fumarate hydratase class I-like protein
MGAGWCPPGMLGIGIGGTAEKAMLMAKESLMEPIDMAELKARGARTPIEELRIELHDKVNALGIGAQGLGGLSTVLDVKILDYPTHAASKPIAMIPNCAATRHALHAGRQRPREARAARSRAGRASTGGLRGIQAREPRYADARPKSPAGSPAIGCC